MHQIYRRKTMSKGDSNKVALQLYWNHISAWVFSCKFDVYFSEHLLLRPPLEGTFSSVNGCWILGLQSLQYFLQYQILKAQERTNDDE